MRRPGMSVRPALRYLGGLVALLGLLLLPHAPGTQAQPTVPRRLIPIGASYQSSTITMFVQQAIAKNSDPLVRLAVVMAPFSTSSISITLEERQLNLNDAQRRANQIQNACAAAVISPTTCITILPDIQTRADAQDASKVASFDPGLDGVYILGGDQVIAMEIIANTPLEDALELLYQAGAPFAGNSAGAAVQSRRMIAGYTGDNSAWNGLEFGAVDLAYGATEVVSRGLRFGLDNAVIEQHAFERGRLARLIQAAQRHPLAKIGLGTDFGTGVVVENERIVTGTTGLYGGVVVDEETYGAAAAARYLGPRETLTISNVVLHLLAPGPYGYDLQARRPIVGGALDATPPDIGGRSYSFLRGAGNAPLLLGGDLATTPTGTVVARFAELARASGRPTVVLAAGFVTPTNAISATAAWARHLATLGVTSIQTATLPAGSDTGVLAAQLRDAGAIFVTGDDQPTIVAELPRIAALDLGRLWRSGRVLLLDNAAAAIAGNTVSAEPTPQTLAQTEIAASDAFLATTLTITRGLRLVPGSAFEPRALYDYRYGRLVNHAFRDKGTVAFGIERGTAIEVSQRGARVLGDSAVFAIDGRYTRVLAQASNEAIAATWLLADTFAPGTTIAQVRQARYLPVAARNAVSPVE